MKTKRMLVMTTLLVLFVNLGNATGLNEPPAWAKHAVWYQIFVERFRNGDTKNDPVPELMKDEKMKIIPPEGWKPTPWTHNWYKPDDWMAGSKQDFNALLQYRRYGGDLQGVLDKLDYLKELGVNAIYFNPLNDAPSLHKYDARNYHHIDVNFGPDPAGDLKIIAAENPGDPSTWQWTSADKMFLRLVAELHQRNIKVILDFSWNHTGTQFWAWLDIMKNQQNSAYKDWFNITSFDDPATPDNEFSYEGWMGNAYMPEVKKVDIQSKRTPGRPYEGNIHPGPKQHIFEVTRRWLAPDGDVKKGIDGFRLDVADHIGLAFWRDWRKYVRSVNPEAYLVGEIWWEKWPDGLMDPVPYINQGDIFDAVMFYQVYRPARYFFARNNFPITAGQLMDSLNYHWNRLPEQNVQAMMNVSSSHDAPRLITDFNNPNKYKFHANTAEDSTYRTGEPYSETIRRLKCYLIHLFTIPGAPQIWNGEEMGMWGADDPHCRRPLIWPDLDYTSEVKPKLKSKHKQKEVVENLPLDLTYFNSDHFRFYQLLIKIRKANPVLATGEISMFANNSTNMFGYKRTNKQGDQILVIFNMGSKSIKYELFAQTFTDLFTDKKYIGIIDISPLTAVILKKQGSPGK